jgi:microcystin-dependent protein
MDPYMGEVKLNSFDFAPKGWAQCNGQLLPINQNQALFSLLGTMYGGDGRTTFALPDLRGRVPVHRGAGLSQGQRLGEEAHTLTQAEMPTHGHQLMASPTNANQPMPSNAVLGGANNAYAAPASLTTLTPQSVGTAGGSQAHENRHPYLALNWCIALVGVFPSRN